MSFESQSQIQPSSDRAEFISNKKQDKNDDGSLDDLSISNDHKAKYRFCSYITKTAKKKVEVFDLTHDSDEDKKKPSGVKVKTEKRFVLDPVEQDPDSVIFSYESPKKKKGDNNRACMHCGSIKCHDDQFSDFAFANVQCLFAWDKALGKGDKYIQGEQLCLFLVIGLTNNSSYTKCTHDWYKVYKILVRKHLENLREKITHV